MATSAAARTEPAGAPTVFVSYARQDAGWFDKFLAVLKPLIADNKLRLWSDRAILAGSRWREDIHAAVAASQAAVFLVTPNFFNSEFISGEELPSIFEQASQRNVRILWVAISASLYQHTPLGPYQCLNDPQRPLDTLSLPEQNRELVRIAAQILSLLTAPTAETVAVQPQILFSAISPKPGFRDTIERCFVTLLLIVSLGGLVYTGAYFYTMYRAERLSEETRLREYIKQNATWLPGPGRLHLDRGHYTLLYERGSSKVVVEKVEKAPAQDATRKIAPPMTAVSVSLAALALVSRSGKGLFAIAALAATGFLAVINAIQDSQDDDQVVTRLRSSVELWQSADAELADACKAIRRFPDLSDFTSQWKLYPSLRACVGIPSDVDQKSSRPKRFSPGDLIR